MTQSLRKKPSRTPLRVAIAVLIVVFAFVAWRALWVGPAAVIEVSSDRPAVGPETIVTASFAEQRAGLGAIRIEIEQAGRTEIVADETLTRPGAFAVGLGETTPEARLEAPIGRKHQAWLREGEVVVRAVAERASGFLRSPEPAVVETRLPVRLRPPQIAVLSRQHYVHQGGSGIVVLSVGTTSVRSGVRAGAVESTAFQLPGGGPGERFVLYAIPWDLTSADIVAFAEDDAGNRAEARFVDGYRGVPLRNDRINVSDSFLGKVVPAIAAQTPEVPADESLLEQYLWINGTLRKANLAEIRSLCADSAERFLWHGAFLQMPNTAKMASFAQPRTYVYQGREVDHQTHLGLDLASTAGASVPAANAGRVLHAGWFGIYGNAVLLDHGFGLATLYGHLSSVSVAAGDTVDRGQEIGRSGQTGLAGGDHLHLEFFVQGRSVNPIEWLDPAWIRDRVAAKLGAAGAELLR